VYQHPLVAEYGRHFMDPACNLLREPVFLEFYETETEKVVLEEELRRKREFRLEQASRIRESIQKKRDEKKIEQSNELAKLSKMVELKESNPEWVRAEMNIMDVEEMRDIEKKLRNLKHKMGLISQEELDYARFYLLEIPDAELTGLQVKQKRMQHMQKTSAERRIITKERTRIEKIEIEKLKTESPKLYLNQLYGKRKGIKDKIKTMKQFREDNNVRKTKNLKMLNVLDNYLDGKVDDYEEAEQEIDMLTKEMRDVNSDMENYETKLAEVEGEIRGLDPNFDDEITNFANLFKVGNLIELGVDAVRPPEILFQPSMVGADQMGLSELLVSIADQFGSDYRIQLLSNIYISGGGAQIRDVGERLKYDIQSEVDKPLDIKVSYSQNPIMDPWHGMKSFTSNKEAFNKFSITKQDWFESGENALKNFCLNNN
jgi:actin-related protein 5